LALLPDGRRKEGGRERRGEKKTGEEERKFVCESRVGGEREN
jgi:hypothetical protein